MRNENELRRIALKLSFPMLGLIAVVAAAGCAGLSYFTHLTPAQRQAMNEAAKGAQKAFCRYDACEKAWERAKAWVLSHSYYKLEVATADRLEAGHYFLMPTGAPGAIPVPRAYRFTVTRRRLSDGLQLIELDMTCEDPANSYPCLPAPEELRGAFSIYLLTGEDLLTQGKGPYPSVR